MSIKKIAAGLAVGAAMFGGSLAMGATAAHASTVLVGNTSVQGTTASISGSDAEAFGYVASASGTATDIHVYLVSNVGATVAIYSDSEGMPNHLIASGTTSSNTANSWVDIPLASSVSLAQGNGYWLSIAPHASTDTVSYKDNDGTGDTAWEDLGDGGTPNPFQLDSSFSDGPASIYVTTA